MYVGTAEHSYLRYEYPTNGIQSKVFAPVVDQDGHGNLAEDEIYSESWFDGAGRVRRSRTEHPGSAGGWTAALTEYDPLGRVTRKSVPTETDPSYTPAGDDAARGYLWTHSKYDWMGRVVRTINTDGTDSPTLNDSDLIYSYEGCGCAGGLVTTIQSENVPRDDPPSVKARRTQKIFADILGRPWKTVVYKWDGTTAYTTTEQTFDGADRVLRTRQTDNTSTASPQTYQEVTTTFDGHGRLKTRHYPIEDANTDTTWNYNPDDSISQVIDPRGVVTDMTYNSRGLTTQVANTPTGSIPDTPTVTFGYDDLGNRTSMGTAGVSEITYAYDPLSRLTSETVDFDDLSNSLTIGYTYGITGPKSVTDPFGAEIAYAHDKAGRLSAVTGDSFAQNTGGNYASGIQYRAFGQLKQMDYDLQNGDSRIKLEYDTRLRVSYSDMTQAGSSSSFILKADFDYLADGRVAAKDDLLDDKWDRTNKFDFAGRLSFNQFGVSGGKRVYEQEVAYDAFSQVTERDTIYWDVNNSSFNSAYVNGRKTGVNAPDYDAAGNAVYTETGNSGKQWTTFDAAGRRIAVRDRWRVATAAHEEHETGYVFDGDGRPVVEKEGMRSIIGTNEPPMVIHTEGYQVWSSVLGASLTTVDTAGNKRHTKVFAGGAHIATQDANGTASTGDDRVLFTTADPVAGATATFDYTDGTSYFARDDTEPLGGQRIERSDPGSGDPSDCEGAGARGEEKEISVRLATLRVSRFVPDPSGPG